MDNVKAIRKFTFSKQGKKEEGGIETLNEDCVYLQDDFGFVLDGATGLTNDNVTPEKSDARWFTREFTRFLTENLGDKTQTIQSILKKGILEVNTKFNSYCGEKEIKVKPSSTIALFRINKNEVEFFVLGDCVFLIRDINNNVKELTTNDLSRLDAQNIKTLIKRAKENNVYIVDARPLVNDELIRARLSQNTKGGYWTLSDSIEAIDNGLYAKMNINEIKQIIAMSDGFSQIFDLFKLYTAKEFADQIQSGKPIEELYMELYNAQEQDNTCNNYPRFKLRDDTTLFNIEF